MEPRHRHGADQGHEPRAPNSSRGGRYRACRKRERAWLGAYMLDKSASIHSKPPARVMWHVHTILVPPLALAHTVVLLDVGDDEHRSLVPLGLDGDFGRVRGGKRRMRRVWHVLSGGSGCRVKSSAILEGLAGQLAACKVARGPYTCTISPPTEAASAERSHEKTRDFCTSPPHRVPHTLLRPVSGSPEPPMG